MSRPSALRVRSAVMALGALSVAAMLPASPAAGLARFQGPSGRITIAVKDRTLSYGRAADVRGRVAGAAAGTAVALQHRVGRGAWTTVARGRTAAGGRFRLRAVIAASGAVRVVAGGGAARAAQSAGDAPGAASAPTRIAVSAAVVPTRRRLS